MKVGVRISPTIEVNDMFDCDPVNTFGTFVEQLNSYNISFIEVVEQRPGKQEAGKEWDNIARVLRQTFKGVYIANGGYDKARASDRLEQGLADAISFGRLFLANPDLPRRLHQDALLNVLDPATFYGRNEHGYTNYPELLRK